MPALNQILPVVIDPNHERYGQSGELYMDQELFDKKGELVITFSDGEQDVVSNGNINGLNQCYIFAKASREEAERLMRLLPDLRDRLGNIFNRVVESTTTIPSRETLAAQAAANFLVTATLYPEMYEYRLDNITPQPLDQQSLAS